AGGIAQGPPGPRPGGGRRLRPERIQERGGTGGLSVRTVPALYQPAARRQGSPRAAGALRCCPAREPGGGDLLHRGNGVPWPFPKEATMKILLDDLAAHHPSPRLIIHP